MHCGDGLSLLLQGYANPGQLAAGIHTRLYARAYLIADPEDTQYVFELHALSLSFISVLRRKQSLKLAPKLACLCRKRFIFVNTDACMAAQGVTIGVMKKLKVRYPQGWVAFYRSVSCIQPQEVFGDVA